MASRLPPPDLPGWISSMVPYNRYRVEVAPGLEMHVMEHGEGRPVLLMHGNPTWGFLYRKVVAELEGEPMRLIMPDLIGLGFSSRPPQSGQHTLANHSLWLSSLIDNLGLADVVAVVQDWGGPIGTHALSRRPGIMTGLVVLNTSLTAPKPGFSPTMFHRVFSTRFGGFASEYLGVPQGFLRFAQGDRSSISGAVSKAYRYPLQRRMGNEAVAALVRMVPSSMDHPSVPYLEEVAGYVSSFTGPSAIVWGERDPVLGRLMRRHERLLPGAEVTPTRAGHFLQEEVPGEIADAIRMVCR